MSTTESKEIPTANAEITAVVTSWPGVTARDIDRGAWSFQLGKRELGHLHGNRLLHIGYPKAVWHELYDAGRIDYHPVFPGKPGYAQRRLETPADIEDAIALLRLNYDRSVAAHGVPVAVDEPAT